MRVSVDDTVALGFKDRFGLLVDAEWTAREQRKLQRRLHSAKLRYPTTLEAVPGGSGTPRGAFPISRSRAHTHRRHGHPLQTVPSAGLIERPQEKNRVDALR